MHPEALTAVGMIAIDLLTPVQQSLMEHHASQEDLIVFWTNMMVTLIFGYLDNASAETLQDSARATYVATVEALKDELECASLADLAAILKEDPEETS